MSSHDEAASLTVSRLDDAVESPVREPRWPPLAAVLVFLGLNVGLRL